MAVVRSCLSQFGCRIGLQLCTPTITRQLINNPVTIQVQSKRDYTMARICDKLQLKGIIAAPCTPFTADASQVNYDAFSSYADHMVSTGITGLFVNGTLGEGMSQTVEERRAGLEQWLKVAKGRFDTIIVHTGAGSINDCRELSAHAEQAGAHAVAVMCPTLFKPSCIADLVTFLKEVAKSCPNTPFMYYDINILTGVVFDTSEVMRQCKTEIPNFSGIKYSCRELNNFQTAMLECEEGRYKIALGTVDEMFLPWLPLGADVPICHSFMGSHHAKIREEYTKGNIKAALNQQNAVQQVGVTKKNYGSDVAVSKAILKMMGQDLGPVRLPLIQLSQEKYDMLKQELTRIKLL